VLPCHQKKEQSPSPRGGALRNIGPPTTSTPVSTYRHNRESSSFSGRKETESEEAQEHAKQRCTRTNYSVLSGYGTIPGNDPYVITVGATNTKGTPDSSDAVMTSHSSKGPTAIDHIVKPDLVAPGNRVVSLQTGGYLQKNYPGNRPAVSYYQTGTSGSVSGKYFIFGEAMVSGAAVCL